MSGPERAGERFRVRKYGIGYRVKDVDAFMDRVESGLVTAREVDKVQFRSVRWSGYDEQEVDETLDEVARRLRASGQAGADEPGSQIDLSRLLRSARRNGSRVIRSARRDGARVLRSARQNGSRVSRPDDD
ncbi:MAG: DivIVA domain-containing protein [Actinomycetes bacterium]